MTKKSAIAISKDLDTRCNEAYMFAVKVGAGCVTSVKAHGDGWVLMTLFINLIEQTMKNLKKCQQDEFYKLLCRALQIYLEDDSPIETREELSGKQLSKRIKNNERILNELEAVL